MFGLTELSISTACSASQEQPVKNLLSKNDIVIIASYIGGAYLKNGQGPFGLCYVSQRIKHVFMAFNFPADDKLVKEALTSQINGRLSFPNSREVALYKFEVFKHSFLTSSRIQIEKAVVAQNRALY